MSDDEAEPSAEAERSAGNAALKEGRHEDAVGHYTAAIALEPEDAKLYSNRSAAYAKLEDHKAALQDAQKCISLDPKFVKGYSRKAYALFATGLFTESIQVCDQGLELEPGNESLKSTKETALARREAWGAHAATAPATLESEVPSWLMSLIAPLRMMLFFFNITAVKQDWAAWSTATKQSSFDYEIASQLALAVFAASCVPDILAKNWRHLMQGHSAHYLALSALLYFGADPIQPPIHIGLIGLVNIPDFLSKDIASMLTGSSYGAAVTAFARKPIWGRLIAAYEVGLGVTFLVLAAKGLFNAGPLFHILYWQWIRIRCMLGQTTKQCFLSIDRVVGPVFSAVPGLSQLYGLLKSLLGYMTRLPEPGEQASVPKCTIM